MDVTVNNFEEILPQVLDAISGSDFIAIDGEFTGLQNGADVTVYDTPAQYYAKLRNGSLDFLLIQVGICTFKYDESKKKYTYSAFNFYVFPRPVNRVGVDSNFLCQASSIKFLCNNGFDFNKVFKEGIPYLTTADEGTLQEELTAKYEYLNHSDSFTKVPIPEELVPVIEDACNKIEKFLLPENQEKELCFEKLNGFHRKLIFQTAYEKFPTNKFSLSTKWVDNSPILVARKGKSKSEQERENYEKDLNDLREAVGFSKVIKHISNSKKLIVGHNMMLDICHIVNRFYWPLPESYWEFKEMVHELFPRVIDTKYMCSAYPFRDLIPSSVMNCMVKKLQEPPFKFVEADPVSSDYGYSTENCKLHEAGYDAYITGLAFITLTSYLGKNSKTTTLITPELIKPYENRLFIMKIMDYSFVNLKGDEPNAARNHVFHITFPKEWKTNDIMQLFSPYGNIHVSYCNQSSAWVTLLDQQKSESVISNLIEPNTKDSTALRKPYSLMTWSKFHEKMSASMTWSRVKEKSSSLKTNQQTATVAASESSRPSSTHNLNSPSSEDVSASDVPPPVHDKSCGEGKTNESLTKSSNQTSGDVIHSRKRKKKNLHDNAEVSSFDDSDVALKLSKRSELSNEVPSKNTSHNQNHKRKKQTSSKDHPDSMFDKLKGDEDNLHKTFEEPSWE